MMNSSEMEEFIKNIFSYVNSVGWENVPDSKSERFNEVYKKYATDGHNAIEYFTFVWLIEMAKYFVKNECNECYVDLKKNEMDYEFR